MSHHRVHPALTAANFQILQEWQRQLEELTTSKPSTSQLLNDAIFYLHHNVEHPALAITHRLGMIDHAATNGAGQPRIAPLRKKKKPSAKAERLLRSA